LSIKSPLPSIEARLGGSSPPGAPAAIGVADAGFGWLTRFSFDFVGGVRQLDGPAPQLLDNFRLD
jgi:hypothetical protein